ncbi:hypothetical protein Hanom_Chr13g01244941 [Helianthus anomalus]
MNSELSIRDFHCFETDLNRINDLTGRTPLMISSWSSNGMLSDIFGRIFMFRVSTSLKGRSGTFRFIIVYSILSSP